MDWKETVMHIEDLGSERLPRTYLEMHKELQSQAETSFKAGVDSIWLVFLRAIAQARKNGIREVVEWIHQNAVIYPYTEVQSVSFSFERWQAFKESRGVK